MNELQPAGAPAGTASEPSADHSARNRLVIAILLVAAFVVILNETIMSVALPRLMVALGASAIAVQWLTTAFLLTMAVVIPVTGFMIQRVNTRPLFLLAMSLFSLGTLAAALSPNLEFLIAARVVQALGTAIMMPLLMTTVMTLVPPDRRGPVMGNISLVISVAPAIGPALSGMVLHYLSWPFLFWLVLPISLAALAFGAVRIVNVTEPRYAPLDYISVPLAAFAFGGIVYGLSSFGVEAGETSGVSPVWPLGAGVVGMVAFVARQIALQREDKPLLDLRTLKTGNYTIGLSMMAVSMMALFGTIILLPIYLQNVLGIDTLQTGLLLLPGGLVMGLLAPHVGRWYDRIGPRPLVLPGTALVSVVLWSMTLLSAETSVWAIFAGHLAISVGLALVFTPLFTVSLSSVEPRLYSHGSALLGSVQQVAGAAGVALFVALMTLEQARQAGLGAAPADALVAGVRTGFLCGAILSLLAVAGSFLLNRAPDFGTGQKSTAHEDGAPGPETV